MNNWIKKFAGHVDDFFSPLGKYFIEFMSIVICLYGWRGFLFRIVIVGILFKLNPLDEAVRGGGPAGGKIWVATCVLLVYAIGKLIYDYTKVGREAEAEAKKRVDSIVSRK